MINWDWPRLPWAGNQKQKIDQQQETSDQHHPPKQWTFRVCGVPLGWDVEQLESLLAEQDNTVGPTVQSLADELDRKSRTATVIFQNLPSPLQMPLAGRRWPISLPAHSNQSTRPQSLTLDNDFLGITTLYAPPPEDHKVE
jgi:protein SERAC1